MVLLERTIHIKCMSRLLFWKLHGAEKKKHSGVRSKWNKWSGRNRKHRLLGHSLQGQAQCKRAPLLNDYMAWSFQELRDNHYPTLNGDSYVLAASTGVWLKSIALTCISRIITQFLLSLPAVARLPAQLHQMSGLSCMVWPTLVGGGMGGQQTINWQCRRSEEEEASLSKSHEKQD